MNAARDDYPSLVRPRPMDHEIEEFPDDFDIVRWRQSEAALDEIDRLRASLSAPVDEDALRARLRRSEYTNQYFGIARRVDAVMDVLREAGVLRPEVER